MKQLRDLKDFRHAVGSKESLTDLFHASYQTTFRQDKFDYTFFSIVKQTVRLVEMPFDKMHGSLAHTRQPPPRTLH